jgi:hypothetical protein
VPYWIEGWLEVSRDVENGEETDTWIGVVNIGSIIDDYDDVSARLFGLSKRPPTNAVAAGRGLPRHRSQAVESALARIREHERRFGAGECGGYTYATWQELAPHVSPEFLQGSDWGLLFDIIERLSKDRRFPCPELIRITVWYNW